MAEILDSGKRREFDTGAVRDIAEGKGRCDLLPLDVIGTLMNDIILVSIEAFRQTGQIHCLHDVLRNFNGFSDIRTQILELSVHFEDGAKKYGEHNWQKGIPLHCYMDSAIRHYLKFRRGDDDERHDRAFVWNIVCGIWTKMHLPEMDDFTEKNNTVCSQT